MNRYGNKLIKFDTIKIRTNINNLITKNIEFNKNYNNGVLTGEYYNLKKDKSIPYNLFIGINYNSQSLTIEFSSKILLDDYPRLITKDTFKQCLNNINMLGICIIDVDSIYEDCYITGDITIDIEYQLTDNDYSTLNRCVGNYRRFRWEYYEKEGIRYYKDVKTQKLKDSLVIYNKEKEIVNNKEFLSTLNNPQIVVDYFKGKTRFEVELNNESKMKKYLDIQTTHISYVFNSKANPILLQFNKIFGEGDILDKSYIKNSETYEMMKNLQYCDGDLKKIEQELKDYNIYSSRSGLTNKMKKYKQLHREMYDRAHNSSNILAKIREKLS